MLKNEIPNCYIRCLVQLEDFEKEVSESKTKSKMNALNLKNYQTMKQKLKKHNKNFEAKIQAFRKVKKYRNLSLETIFKQNKLFIIESTTCK